jgi:hypothetical protein
MTSNSERQDNPFLPNFEPEPDPELQAALDSPKARAMIQKLADDIDALVLAEHCRKHETAEPGA